jgi:redox-sensitive bicupin YhaK (pirin superfamily)
MITLRRALERRHDLRRRQEVWLTFDDGDQATPHHGGFEPLETLNEERFAPAAGVPRHFLQDAEIVTYVREGELSYETSTGGLGMIRAGEFNRVTAGRGLHVAERNLSRVDWAHVFQIWVRPSATGLEPSMEKRRFRAAQRRGAPCLVASPDGRGGSLRIHQDALIYSALLDPGQHVVHELATGRRAWLHVVKGEVVLGQELLLRGDGAGITGERAVSFTARTASEVLLLDLGAAEASPPARG